MNRKTSEKIAHAIAGASLMAFLTAILITAIFPGDAKFISEADGSTDPGLTWFL